MSFCLRPHKIQHRSVRDDSDLGASVPFSAPEQTLSNDLGRNMNSVGQWNHVEPHRNHMVSEHGIAVSCVTPPMEPRGTAQEPHGS